MISIHEKDSQILGECRTGVIIDNNMPKVESTLLSLKYGRCFITNGPQFFIKAIADKNYEMGDCIRGNSAIIRIEFLSTKELGNTGNIKVYSGVINEIDEKLILQMNVAENLFTKDIEISSKKNMYIRASFEGNSYRGKRISLTNPIWNSPN